MIKGSAKSARNRGIVQSDRDVDGNSWKMLASCRAEDPELFFHPDGPADKTKAQREAKAKKICRGCKVIEACLMNALETRDNFAILGGMTARERKDLMAKAPRSRRMARAV